MTSCSVVQVVFSPCIGEKGVNGDRGRPEPDEGGQNDLRDVWHVSHAGIDLRKHRQQRREK